MDNGDGSDSGSLKQMETLSKIQKCSGLLVVDVELEEVVRQLAVMDRMPGVEPFAEQNEAIGETFLERRPLDDGPLFEQVVLRMHSFRDQVAAALQNHLPRSGEMQANVRAVQLLFDDERWIGEEPIRLAVTQMPVIRSPR